MNDKKTITVIDGQVFQSGAWHRGMGKYSFELLKSSLTKLEDSQSDVILILNKNLVIDKDAIDALDALVGNKNIFKIDLVLASRDADKDRRSNKQILNDFMDKGYPDYDVKFLILSLFLDNGCAVFPDNAAKFLLFYDSIPFLYPNKYRDRINYDNYLTHYATVFEADIIFAISQTVADDTVINFGISEDKVVNIDGARIGEPSKIQTKPEVIRSVKKFILCPTGDELRKNNLRAVQGFELFNQRHKNEYKLVLTSFFSDYTIKQLSAVSDNLIFTKNIPFNQLEWLYTNTDLVLFPSEYEGLGLPILEAVTYSKKISCSDIPVFKEISEDAFYYFDPLNPLEIAKAIATAVKAEEKVDKNKYREIAEKYTWANTGNRVAEIISAVKKKETKDRLKIAIFAPSPDGYSAIGKVVAESHSSLSEYFDITYYFEKGPEHRYLRPDFLSKIAKNYEVQKFNLESYKSFDAVIYHIGNSEYHLSTIANALVYPGFCIFHDTNLGGAFGLLRNLGYISNERYLLEQQLDVSSRTIKGKYLSSVAANQEAVFVHSDYAADAVKETASTPEVYRLNLPVDVPKLSRKKNNKSIISVGLAGIIAGIKGIELVEELAQSRLGSELEIKIFGYLQSEVIKDQLKRLTNVSLVTNPTDFEFQNLLSKLDILLNFRMSYQGETSLTVLEAMRNGVVVIVRDIGWYSELPDAAVVKVKTKEEALTAILSLVNNPGELAKIGETARKYIRENHSHLSYAEKILDTINAAKGSELHASKVGEYINKNGPSKSALLKYIKI